MKIRKGIPVIDQHDKNYMYGRKFGVRGVPTMLLFKGGEVVDSKVGAASKEDIKTWINSKVG